MPTTRKDARKRKTARKARVPARAGARTIARRTTSRPARRQVRLQKPEGLRLRTVEPSLTVNDLEASLTWYRDALGFVVKERWEHDGKLAGVELSAGNVRFYLSQDDWQRGRDRAKGEGFRLYCTTSQGVDGLAAKIRERGGRLLQEPHDEPWGGRAFTVADPDGYKITITSA